MKYVNIKPSAASLLWPLYYIKSVIKAILFLTGNTCEFHTSSCGCGAAGENIQSKGGKADPFNLMVKWNFSPEWNFYNKNNKPTRKPEEKKTAQNYLEFDCFEEDEQRGAGVVFHVVVHTQRQPVGQHLLHYWLCPPKHQCWVLGCHRFLDKFQ